MKIYVYNRSHTMTYGSRDAHVRWPSQKCRRNNVINITIQLALINRFFILFFGNMSMFPVRERAAIWGEIRTR
jgi:hypothetical protein